MEVKTIYKMGSKNTIVQRVHNKFYNELIKDVQIQRIRLGKDPPLKPQRSARLTLAITRTPEFKILKQRLINADLP